MSERAYRVRCLTDGCSLDRTFTPDEYGNPLKTASRIREGHLKNTEHSEVEVTDDG